MLVFEKGVILWRVYASLQLRHITQEPNELMRYNFASGFIVKFAVIKTYYCCQKLYGKSSFDQSTMASSSTSSWMFMSSLFFKNLYIHFW